MLDRALLTSIHGWRLHVLIEQIATMGKSLLFVGLGVAVVTGKNYTNPFTSPCNVQGKFANLTTEGIPGEKQNISLN